MDKLTRIDNHRLDDGQIGPIPLDDGQIGHHCGIAYVRSRKDYDTLAKKYSDPYFLLNLVYLMLLRQRNRGLDGAGIATAFIPYTNYVEQEYMFKDKMISKDAVSDLYESLMQKDHTGKCLADQRKGDCMIGHVLYSTMLSTVSYRYVHPVEHQDPWPHRRITIAMNGNFANNSEQREFLRSVGQAPTSRSDMEALVESFGHFLGLAHIRMMQRGLSPEEISEQLDLVAVMRKVNQQLQGAFALEGIVGNGDSFLARDPFGIRPLYYAIHDDFIIGASEWSAIQSTFAAMGLDPQEVKELPAGHILVVKSNGKIILERYAENTQDKPCMFEPVYFNRPNNRGTYNIRKRLGAQLAKIIQNQIPDLNDTIVSYVPNTSETAALGLYEELLRLDYQTKARSIFESQSKISAQEIEKFLEPRIRFEQTLTKDLKIRTFITQKKHRQKLVLNAYDSIEDSAALFRGKRIIAVDDSIVKGTTLERNVIRTLIRAGAKQIVIASSCPQIRYPCPYGIEMSTLKEFIAFRAAIALNLEHKGQEHLDQIHKEAIYQQERIDSNPTFLPSNLVAQIYEPFHKDQISAKIADLVRPSNLRFDGEIRIIYPSVQELVEGQGRGQNLDKACLDGSYPELGGLRVLNRALLNYFENLDERAY